MECELRSFSGIQMKTWSPLKPILLLLTLIWNSQSTFFSAPTSTVKTSLGPIQGTQIVFNGRIVEQYLGVPFAKPPVGELRFRRPQPLEPWPEILIADKFPPACIQFSAPFPWFDFQDGKSEDCLYLNIWVPKSYPAKLGVSKIPVMFWIHGGGFTIGSGRKPNYDGLALAADGDVIVVTINYRITALGFLTSGTEDAPGNQAMYDMLEALKWVNNNIAAFGGDPNQVTIFGESAGSISAGLLCVSPLTKGLFQRVILESGSPAYLIAENMTINIMKSQRLAKAVGCADDVFTIYDNPKVVVECLRTKDAFLIAKTMNSFDPNSTILFFPVYGDEILPVNARLALISGDFQNVDVLIGNVHDEGAFQITTGNPDYFGFFGEKNPKVNKTYGEFLIKQGFGSFPASEAVVQYYLGNLQEDDYYIIRKQVYTALGDFILLCPTVYFAESYSRNGNNVYYFFFTHRPSTTPWAPWMGAVHDEEVQFVFGVPLRVPERYTIAENYLSRRMVKIWSSFAKQGNPGEENWPLYSRENPIYVDLNTRKMRQYGKGPHRNNCDFFRPFFGFL